MHSQPLAAPERAGLTSSPGHRLRDATVRGERIKEPTLTTILSETLSSLRPSS
jgi:hypothetical protein